MTLQICDRTGHRLAALCATTLLGLMTLVATMPANAQSDSPKNEQTWQMATRNADIQEFVAQVAKITGKTFVVDPKLKGQVNVISETPLGKDGWYELSSACCDYKTTPQCPLATLFESSKALPANRPQVHRCRKCRARGTRHGNHRSTERQVRGTS